MLEEGKSRQAFAIGSLKISDHDHGSIRPSSMSIGRFPVIMLQHRLARGQTPG